VRAAYKAVQNPKELQKELPQCALGSLLLTWIKQVRALLTSSAGWMGDVPVLQTRVYSVHWLLWLARFCHCVVQVYWD
jgi:hypothetical protein